MPGITATDLDDIFSYHTPDEKQIAKYQTIRSTAKLLAQVILDNTPGCPDQTVAIRKLRECVMVANAAIALNGKY